jgi:hypothetical protein
LEAIEKMGIIAQTPEKSGRNIPLNKRNLKIPSKIPIIITLIKEWASTTGYS